MRKGEHFKRSKSENRAGLRSRPGRAEVILRDADAATSNKTKAACYDTGKTMRFGPLEEKYSVKHEVARGGYGAVYYAEAKGNPAVRVAIKAYFPNNRFYYPAQELLYMKLLRGHEVFPTPREAVLVANQVMLVMDWVEGEGFRAVQKKNDPREAVRYMKALFRCLSILHQYGIVHHDVKPQNFVYNTKTGKGVLLDFGTMLLDHTQYTGDVSAFIKELDKEKNLLVTSIIKNQRFMQHYINSYSHIGTPVYSALEKNFPYFAHNDVRALYFSPKVDLWSAGCIFLELLFGVSPFFSWLLIHGRDAFGKSVKTQDKLPTFLVKLANVLGRKLLESKVCSLGSLRLALPEDLPAEPLELGRYQDWRLPEHIAAAVLTSVLAMLNPVASQRPDSQQMHRVMESILELLPAASDAN